MKNLDLVCISLDNDIERRNRLESSIDLSNFRFEYFFAINGKKISAIDYYHYNTDRIKAQKRILTPSEIGATLSHLNVLKRFIESRQEKIFIIEDDIIVSNLLLDNIIQSVDKYNLEGLILCGGQDGMEYFNWDKYLLGKEIYPDIFLLPKFSYQFVTRACCYILNKEAASIILKKNENFIHLADDWNLFFKDTDIPVYFINKIKHPLDVIQQSNIEQERVDINDTYSKNKFIA
ncbi:MAG: glycosyltransferase family 25 protein, partial [Acinetobacter populi]|uniref:glycosyltransferase family 25 protein n=1 Tax=Acinetobacter populi TaxID=1582270 RepID=UPI0023529F90